MDDLSDIERAGVPVIDMQKVDGLAKEIVTACEEWGCFRIINHGVPKELMAEMKAVAASIFDLPEEIKSRTVHPNEPGKGYLKRNLVGPYVEGLSDASCPNEFCDRLDASPHQRKIIDKYIKAIRDVAGVLGQKLMEGNGLAGDLFDGWCYEMIMNKFHYGPESVGSTGMRIHSDLTFLTILQDDDEVNGLQVADKYSDDFIPVDHLPGSLVVNVGDIGKAWSNGRFRNVQHRVWCFDAKTRYSIAILVLGPNDKKIEAPSELVDSNHPRLYNPIDIKEFRHFRATTGLNKGGTLELYKASV